MKKIATDKTHSTNDMSPHTIMKTFYYNQATVPTSNPILFISGSLCGGK